MRLERLSERAVILRDLGCPAFELARELNLSIFYYDRGGVASESSPQPVLNDGVLRREVEPLDKRVSSFDSQETANDDTVQGVLAQDDAVLEEAVASYETVGLYFSEPVVRIDQLHGTIAAAIARVKGAGFSEPKLIEIPVCYELGPDLASAAEALQMSAEKLISLHLAAEYRCYAVGFSPGFAYLGYLPDRIASLPRLASPRPRVEPGSVGITGRQTAVYPSATPGGWNLIGRCPLTLVDVDESYFPIEAGDQVRFRRIDEAEFGRLKGERV